MLIGEITETGNVNVRMAKLLVIEAHLKKLAERTAAIEQELITISRIIRDMVGASEV